MLKELSKEVNSIKKIQSETKDTLIEIKNNLQGINSRVDKADNQISDLEYEEAKTTNHNSKRKKRIQKNEDNVRNLWDNFKHNSVYIMEVPEEEEREQENGNLFEKIMTENFPNLVKEINIQVQEVQKVPNQMNSKRLTSRHIIMKKNLFFK